MTIGSNLSLRIAAILLIGFIALQLLIAMVALPSDFAGQRPYNLPHPHEAAALAAALDRTPRAERAQLVEALDGGLYTLRLAAAPPEPLRAADDAQEIAAAYAAAMPGRAIAVDGRRPRFGRLIGGSPRPARFLAPIRVAIPLSGGGMLVITSQPSDAMRAYFRGRAAIGALGGLLLLVALMLAVRQTTRPLVRLAQGVRGLAASLDAPDLPVEGPREVRELSGAFNEMKTRIRGLIAERSRVLAAVAHDMRTYLTRLRLRAEYIDDGGHRARAVRDLDEMAALLDDTLFFAGRDAAPPPALAEVDLGEELRAMAEARRELGEAVALDAVPAGLRIRATPLAVRRVLANLIDNGLRYGSRVAIRARQAGSAAEVTVEDDGPGVPAERLARLGEPFHRLDESRSRDTGGAGLGLAIVRALADRDGATVRFANRREGGLEVVVAWPLSRE